jgi:hypothetical protein
MNDQAASQLKTAFSQLETKSQDGAQDATVSGGGMLTQVGGPISFSGISSAQNNTVDSIINELMAQLDGNQTT